jgi:hypothetical protein
MQILEGIFYTNLTDDLTQFITEIRQKEIIDDYTVFVIYAKFNCNNENCLKYFKFWKSHDCIVLDIDEYEHCQLKSSNGKYLCTYQHTFDDFKKLCIDCDLLENHIKFTYKYRRGILKDNLYFRFEYYCPTVIGFNYKPFTVNEFIEEILTNYPEFYKFNYSQIKPANSI